MFETIAPLYETLQHVLSKSACINCLFHVKITYISLFLKANTNNVDVNQRGIEIRVGVEGWGGRVTMATRRPPWTIDAHRHHTLGHTDPLSLSV